MAGWRGRRSRRWSCRWCRRPRPRAARGWRGRPPRTVPARFMGSDGAICATRSGSPPEAWMSVSMMPGRTALTRMPSAGELEREADGEGVDRALGGGVVDVDAGRAELGRRRREVDDAAALAAVLGRHAEDRGLGAEEGAGDVDREDAVDAGGVHLVDARRCGRRCRHC